MKTKTNYTTTMKGFILSWSFCFISIVGFSQLADPPYCIEIIPHYEEPYIENIPGCGITEIDLSGYITYRIYAVLQDPEDCVGAVFGGDPIGDTQGDCVSDSMDMCLIAPCGIFDHPLSTGFFSSSSCLFIEVFPSNYYDTFATIGSSCDDVNGQIIHLIHPCDSLFDDPDNEDDCDFFDGGNFYFDSNGYYNVSNPEAGDDLKVLVAQITTCGEICGKFGIGILDDCIDGQELIYESPFISFCQPNPCTEYPMTASSTAPLYCEGQEGITFFEGGMGYVDYQLYEAETDLWLSEYAQVQGDLELSDLLPGEYYLTMIDSVGCRDTSDVFAIVGLNDLPEEFESSASIVGSLNCSGDTLGNISMNFSGGTLPYTVYLDDTMFTFDTPQENYLLEDVSCGHRVLTISDAYGCNYTEEFDVLCYEPIDISISLSNPLCYGDEGSVEIAALNDFSNVFMAWSDVEQFGESSIIDLSEPILYPMIGSGVYSLYVLDSLGCPSWFTVELTDPFELTCSISSSNETFGNDAWACVQTNGGTGLINYQWNTGSTSICIENLMAGEYSVLVTDENGCLCTSEVILYTDINEPSPTECKLLSTTVSDELVIQCSSDFENFEIVDAKGSRVLKGTMNQQKSISTQSLSSGKYIITLRSPSTSLQLEFVKI